jgi:hypothetical protein
MSIQQVLENWIEEVSSAVPVLSMSQTRVLGLYSYGMMLTWSCPDLVEGE